MAEGPWTTGEPEAAAAARAARWRLGVGGWLALAAMLPLLAFAVWGFWALWTWSGGGRITIHGWLAMALAVTMTAVLGGGLMWLAFYSSRRGWDDLDREP